ncbi:hypothetical protein [Bradyrhizobium sp.]|uniref:hypothetical protein n=1 Tax=Bradyrhizobium sp. TaxID=376 RepID=UPI003C772D7A
MTSTFASAMENVTDEELKLVAGGARANTHFQATADHLLEHGDLRAVAVVGGLLSVEPDGAVAVAAPLGSPGREAGSDNGSYESSTWPLPP